LFRDDAASSSPPSARGALIPTERSLRVFHCTRPGPRHLLLAVGTTLLRVMHCSAEEREEYPATELGPREAVHPTIARRRGLRLSLPKQQCSNAAMARAGRSSPAGEQRPDRRTVCSQKTLPRVASLAIRWEPVVLEGSRRRIDNPTPHAPAIAVFPRPRWRDREVGKGRRAIPRAALGRLGLLVSRQVCRTAKPGLLFRFRTAGLCTKS
jgi:hypothetical protein